MARLHSALYHAHLSTSLTPVAPIEDLETALSFASNHGLGVAIAAHNLTNRPATSILRGAHRTLYRSTPFPTNICSTAR